MTKATKKEIEAGDAAPEFAAADEAGNRRRLKDYRGKTVVLYFYPKDHTSGCTAEACGFRDSFASLKRLGVVVLGVSPDGAESHASFKAKHELPFALLADEDKKLCRAYGVWKEKSMYGRKYMGVERSTFLIGPDGKVRAAWRKVKVPGHVDEVRAAL